MSIKFTDEHVWIRPDAAGHVPRRAHHLGARDPAVVVDRAVAEHLEVLGVMCRRGVRVLLVEGVHHADALDRALLDAIDHRRLPDVRGLEDRRHDVDDMAELSTDAGDVGDVAVRMSNGRRFAACHRKRRELNRRRKSSRSR